ncbi:hypothetical protein U1Q18_002432 [Sarracenia purpurea var. burkii]
MLSNLTIAVWLQCPFGRPDEFGKLPRRTQMLSRWPQCTKVYGHLPSRWPTIRRNVPRICHDSLQSIPTAFDILYK